MLSLVQSDNPNFDRVATWKVSNMAIATIDGFRESKQRSQRLTQSMKEAVDLEQFKLFLTCLDEELGFVR